MQDKKYINCQIYGMKSLNVKKVLQFKIKLKDTNHLQRSILITNDIIRDVS